MTQGLEGIGRGRWCLSYFLTAERDAHGLQEERFVLTHVSVCSWLVPRKDVHGTGMRKRNNGSPCGRQEVESKEEMAWDIDPSRSHP